MSLLSFSAIYVNAKLGNSGALNADEAISACQTDGQVGLRTNRPMTYTVALWDLGSIAFFVCSNRQHGLYVVVI